MTNEEAIEVLNKINPFNDNSKMQEYFESVELAINSVQENTKLKAEIEQLKHQIETRIKVSEANFDIYLKLEAERDNLIASVEQLKSELEQSCSGCQCEDFTVDMYPCRMCRNQYTSKYKSLEGTL